MSVTNNQQAHAFWRAGAGFVRVDGCQVTHVPGSGDFVLTFLPGRVSDPRNVKLTIAVGLGGSPACANFVWTLPTVLVVSVWDLNAAPPVKIDPDELSITVEIIPRVS